MISRSVLLFAAIPLAVSTLSLQAAVLPTDRAIDWSASGIPGGIAVRSVERQVTGLNSDGTTDNRAVLQAAIDACPAEAAVKIPAGTFAVNGALRLPSNITVRGAGPGKTIIKQIGNTGSSGTFTFGSGSVPYDPAPSSTTITGGATAGSNSITVTSATGITVGSYLVITELNDPSFVSIDSAINSPATWVDGWNTGGTRSRGQIVEVTGVSGNTVQISPGLYSAYSRTPWATRFTAGCKNTGVEDLTVQATNSSSQTDNVVGYNFLMQAAAYCWLLNVEGDFCDDVHAAIDWSYRCEVRHSNFHDAYNHSSGNRDNFVAMRYKSSGCLIVDNIFGRLLAAAMVNWGAAGNVIAYNFTYGEYSDIASTGATWMPFGLSAGHGAHPQFNLFEGNVTNKFAADSYWGTASHTVVLRNWLIGHGTFQPPYSQRGALGTPIAYAQELACIQLWEGQTKFSVLGNILGDSTMTNAVYRVTHPQTKNYSGTKYIWNIGYISSSDTGTSTPVLPSPSATLIDHGNWDAPGNSQRWDGSISDRSIPNSLFLASKPSWFGDRAWPAFEPANPGAAAITNIPAGYRYMNGGIDPPGAILGAAPRKVTTTITTQ